MALSNTLVRNAHLAATAAVDRADEDFVVNVNDFTVAAGSVAAGDPAFAFMTPAIKREYLIRAENTLRSRKTEIKRARRTPEEIEEEKAVWAVRRLIRSAVDYQESAANWALKFTNEPDYWCANAQRGIEAGARYGIVVKLLSLVVKFGYTETVRIAQQEALRGAQYPERSSDSTSNLATQYRVSEWAAFAQRGM